MDASVTNVDKLDVFFLPFLTPGHMIPLVDMARIFAAQDEVNVTIITTPYNALLFQNSIDQDFKSGHQISIHLLSFPFAEVGLPEGIENFNATKTHEMPGKLYLALSLLQPQIEQLFRERRPDCIVSDMFFPWTVDVAAQLGIPRLLFNPTGFFALSAMDILEGCMPHQSHLIISSDSETLIVPGLPDQIKMTKTQLPDHLRNQTPFTKINQQIRDSVPGSFGVVVNSFYELEPAYVEHYRKTVKNKAWPLGPVSLCNKDSSDKAQRAGGESESSCLNWLDSQKPNSVLYVSFGSMIRFSEAQLHEIALGLEASGHPFIWVVRKKEGDKEEKWLPEGFEEKMKKKGLIIRGWAPQVLILDHPAVGGFLNHAGWNSVLESVSLGVPMITWPLYAEQFYNEKLVIEVLRIGVAVGVEKWRSIMPKEEEEEDEEIVTREEIERAVIRLMDGGEEAMEILKKVRDLGEKSKSAVEKGGSSYTNITHLIQELKLYRSSSRQVL